MNHNLPDPNRIPGWLVPAGFFSLLALTTALAVLVRNGLVFPFDLPASRLSQSWQAPLLTSKMVAIAWLFGSWRAALVALPVAALVWWRLGWRAALLVALATLLGVLETPLKALVERPRPPESLVQVLDLEHGFGFPSGHMLFTTLLTGALAWQVLPRFQRRAVRVLIGAVLAVVFLVVAFSRVYLGVHWLSDVLGGLLAGGTLLLGLVWAGRWLIPRMDRWRRRPPAPG
jgi:undecaprenyl-diphosphatase